MGKWFFEYFLWEWMMPILGLLLCALLAGLVLNLLWSLRWWGRR